MQNNERLVLFLTGIPGTGKSTAAKVIEELTCLAGLNIVFVNDYPILKTWAYHNRGNERLVHWENEMGVENFTLQESAYPLASRFVAATIAHELPGILNSCHIAIVEAARGAATDGTRDRYDNDLFAPIISSTRGIAQFANIEMSTDNVDVLHQRVADRYAMDPSAPPVEVIDRYISPTKGIQSSVLLAEELAVPFLVNAHVDNSGYGNSIYDQLKLIMNNILYG